MKRVVVIGAGMAGLSAAYYLEKLSREHGIDLHCTVLERHPWLGGKVRTEIHGDTVVEAGPDSYISQKPWATDLIRDLGIDDQIIPSRDHLQRVCVVNRRRLVPFPKGFRLAIPTEWKPFLFTRLISPWGKLRMACDYVIPARTDDGDESLASFIRRRLGNEALQKMAGPMMAGIYSGDPEDMSILGTFPMFREMEQNHGSLIRAMLKARRRAPPPAAGNHPGGMFLSLRGGMSVLPEAVRAALRGDIRTECGADALRREGGHYLVRTEAGDELTADAVVIATAAPNAATLVGELAPGIAQRLNAIRHLSTATLSLRFRRDGFSALRNGVGPGFIVPLGEQETITACTFSSCKFAHRTGDHSVLLRAFVGGPRNSEQVHLPDDQLLDAVLADLRTLLGIDQQPESVHIFRWPHANPQYDVGHLNRMQELENELDALPGLHLTGCAYRGVGVPDVIQHGKKTAEQIVAAWRE